MPVARLLPMLALLTPWWESSTALADVVVLANRSAQALEANVVPRGAQAYKITLPRGVVRPLFSDKALQLEFLANGERRRYSLDANSAYFFGQTNQGYLDLQKIGLGGTPETLAGRRLPGNARTAAPAVITVKLLVDEEETSRREVWERRLRGRVAKASAILERHAGVRLQVVAVDEWRSKNETRDFFRSLKEFEQAVDPKPARLAIGFTSQFETPRGRTHLGGIRGPLRSHVMIREWSRIVNEPEKLELLVHELGHFLGATHSPERGSVMRPVLGDRQSRYAGFEIRFDPVNTLIMSMVGEEMRRRGANQFTQLTPGTRMRLQQIYKSLLKAIPGDRSAAQFQQLTAVKTKSSTLAGQTRRVLHAITTAAEANARKTEFEQLTGDLLTEHYVQVAAAEADKLPKATAGKAFLLAVGMSVGEASSLQRGLQGRLVQQIERPEERALRTQVIGRPTIGRRRDLAKHMMVSAALTAGASAERADALGYAKEAIDAQGASGFSFVDLAADRAGVRFAERVLSGKFPLRTLAKHFRIAHYMPPTDDLPEGLSGAELIRRFGGKGDERFEAQMAEIETRIDALPPYSPIRFGL